MREGRPNIALVTSGLGSSLGGIGVVSQSIMNALCNAADVAVWRHPHRWPWLARVSALGAKAMIGLVRQRPGFVLYEHVDLAQLHLVIPALAPIPYGVFLHGIEVWRPLDLLQRRALERASVLLVNSANTETEARRINPWLPPCKVVWLGVPVGPEPSLAGERAPVALVVGRTLKTEGYKGHGAVLDAWPELKRQVPDARLVIAGGGSGLEDLRHNVRLAGLESVEVRGHVSDAERDLLYRQSRLLLFPSTREGFGLVAMEAAAAGTPVLALNVGIVREIFGNSEGVVLAEDATGAAVARAAAPILENREMASRRGRAAWQRAHDLFSEEQFHRRLREACAPWLKANAA